MKSVWTRTTVLPSFSKLNRDITTHVLIIGGGMTGILCAYMMQQAGIDYALVEADRICCGITGYTTAKITVQHGLIYDKLIRRFGEERARQYLKANQEALNSYTDICGNLKNISIDCNYVSVDSYVYSVNHYHKLKDELDAITKIGGTTMYSNKLNLPFTTQGAVKLNNQAMFNPLKFISAIALELNIYEHTKVRKLGVRTALTDSYTIHAENIIIATHFPFLNKHGAYFLKLYQNRSYVLALENAADVMGMYVDENDKGMSFRNYNNLLLLGGGGHRTGKPGGGWDEITDSAGKCYPHSIIKYRYATQDCMSLDDVPYIGRYSSHTDGLYVATGYNKWGMTSSMVAALLLRDLVVGRKNDYEQLFSPQRSVMRTQLLINAGESIHGLVSFKPKRCPHMGCALRWNKDEHSWDCPCHGSRFTEDGKLINNPATDDIE